MSGFMLLCLAALIGAVTVWRLFRLQSQVEVLLRGIRGSLESGVIEVDRGLGNHSLQAINLFVQELLLRQRESTYAREQYPVGDNYLESGRQNISDPIQEINSKLLRAIVGRGDISVCALLSGNSTKLVIDNLHTVERLADGRVREGIISSAEEILNRRTNPTRQPEIVPVEDLKGSGKNLNVVGIHSILTSCNHGDPSTKTFLWLGLRKGAALLSSADEERLRELVISTKQLLLLVDSLKKVLSDERDNIIGMSHDLRTPGVTAMYVLNDLMSTSELSTEVISKLEIAERCLRDQLNGITEFVRAGKAERGSARLEIREVSIVTVLTETICLYELHALARGVRFDINCSAEIVVKTDETILRRILSNIISNAAKYSESGVVEVTVQKLETDLAISIINTAHDFGQQNRTNSLGMGLNVVERLAHMLGGSFSFNRQSDNRVEAKLLLESVVLNSEAPLFNRILVVDDDAATVRMHSRYVREIAHHVDTAATAEEAVELLRLNHYDLVLSDIMFRSSASVVAILNELGITRSDTRVVLISGSLVDDILLLNDRPVPRLVKPISKADLLDILRPEEIQLSKLRPNYSTI
jgi:CheY-like chemotaxis protein